MIKVRMQFGSVIVEVVDHPESDNVLVTISKARYDEDAVQVSLPRGGAKALGHLLIGDE